MRYRAVADNPAEEAAAAKRLRDVRKHLRLRRAFGIDYQFSDKFCCCTA